VSRIGEGVAEVKFKGGSTSYAASEELVDHGASIARIVELLEEHGTKRPDAVGHRIVHGGQDFEEPAVIDDAVEAAIEKNIPLAPLHNPAGLLGIRVARRAIPEAPHVAVFDTAFHATMPPESYRYALPKELYEQHGIRRYGFHGTSYGYVLRRLSPVLGAASPSIIVFHLGNGASAACIKAGKCLDTTMGLTPLEGLMMGTRSGDVDAGVFSFLCRELGESPDKVDAILNKKSGLLGLSGLSFDMRTVAQAAAAGDEDARLARAVYVQRVRKYLGAYLVRLDGRCDALVFTAGVGENDVDLRAAVCHNLALLGLDLDPDANRARSSTDEPQLVSSPASRIPIFVVPTNEEAAIAVQSVEAAAIPLA